MACNNCETNFQSHQSVVVSVQKSGSDARLFVQNQGRNIIQIRRILLCSVATNGSTFTMFLRPPPDPISWNVNSAFLEPVNTALYFTLSNVSPGTIVQAQVEYIEIDGRMRSCPTTI
jgi:hypothetical protein